MAVVGLTVMEMPSHTKESSDGDTKGLELLGRSAMRKAVVALPLLLGSIFDV